MKKTAVKSLFRCVVGLGVIVAVGLGATATVRAVTLEECIRAALDNNPDVQAAVTRIQAAEHMIQQARSAYYPRLHVSGAYSITDNPPQAFMMDLNQRDLNMRDPGFDPNDPDPTDNLRFSVGIGYRLYNGGVNALNVGMAEDGKAARALHLSAVQNELIHQVTRGYYGLLQAQAFVTVQEESVRSLEESLRVATVRFGAGSVVKTDVLNLDVRLAQAQEDLILAKNGVQLAVASLNTAIGSDLITPTGLPVPRQEPLREQPVRLDETAVDNRPELKAAQRMSAVKEQAYQSASRAQHPTVNAFGSYDMDSGDATDYEGSYLVGVMAQWEFFDGHQRSSQALSAKAEWRASQMEERKIRNQLRLDLHQAYLKVPEAWERLQVTQKSVASAREALRITGEQYKEGAADITVLLTAQVGLTAQKTRHVAAYYDYLTALSNFERARGEAIAKYRR